MENEKRRKSLWSKTFTATIAGVLLASLVLSVIIAALGEDFRNSDAGFFLSYAASGAGLVGALLFVSRFCKAPLGVYYNKKTDWRFYLAVPLIAAGCFFAFSGVNSAFIEFLSKFGYVASGVSLPAPTFLSVSLGVLLICIVPAVIEEVLFRGLIALGLKSYGKVKAVVISALLFTVYHMNAAQTPYQLLLGLVFAFLAVYTGSVIPTTLLHFLNNLVVLILCYVAPDFAGFSVVDAPFVVCGGLVLLCLGFFWVFWVNKKVSRASPAPAEEKTGDNRPIDDLLYLTPGLIVALAVWIASLFPG